MATSKIFLVFILPAVFSVAFATFVMADILQNPDREGSATTVHQMESVALEVIGISKQYSTSEPITVQVRVNDRSLDCGDLYITIYTEERPVSQQIFLNQCLTDSNILPIQDTFSENISTAGSYRLVVQMISTNLNNISVEEVFTVR